MNNIEHTQVNNNGLNIVNGKYKKLLIVSIVAIVLIGAGLYILFNKDLGNDNNKDLSLNDSVALCDDYEVVEEESELKIVKCDGNYGIINQKKRNC